MIWGFVSTRIWVVVDTRIWFAVSTERFCGHRFGKLCPQNVSTVSTNEHLEEGPDGEGGIAFG